MLTTTACHSSDCVTSYECPCPKYQCLGNVRFEASGCGSSFQKGCAHTFIFVRLCAGPLLLGFGVHLPTRAVVQDQPSTARLLGGCIRQSGSAVQGPPNQGCASGLRGCCTEMSSCSPSDITITI